MVESATDKLLSNWELKTPRLNYADSGSFEPDFARSRYLNGTSMGTRYRNPIVNRAWNVISNPLHRWYMAQYDKIGKRLTFKFIQRGFSKPFHFYDTDDIYATKTKWSDEVNSRLKSIKAYDWFKKAGVRHLVHGYQATKLEWILTPIYGADPNDPTNMKITSYTKTLSFDQCYSDHEFHQILPNNAGTEVFKRATQSDVDEVTKRIEKGEKIEPIKLNDILEIQVRFRPELPLLRGYGRMNYVTETWKRGQFFMTQSGVNDNNSEYGESVFSAIWEAMVKLAEKSENDHFRQSLFAQVRLNPEWKGQTARSQNFVRNALFAINNGQVFASHPYIDQDGKVTDVPNIQIQNQVRDSQPTRASHAGIGALLDSDWASITVESGYSIKYFMGDPAGAMEAGQVDALGDLVNDIANFGYLANDMIIPFLKLLTKFGVFQDILPADHDWDDYTIKSWWQVEYENKQKALFEASHYASGISVSPSGGEKPMIPKMPTDRKNEDDDFELSPSVWNAYDEQISKVTGISLDRLNSCPIEVKSRMIREIKNMVWVDDDEEPDEYLTSEEEEYFKDFLDLIDGIDDESIIEDLLNSEGVSDWIACCLRKHGPKGDGSMTKAQCIAAAYSHEKQNETIEKRPSQIEKGKQKVEYGSAKKLQSYIGKIRNLPSQECKRKVKAMIKKLYPDRDNQAIQKQASKICKGSKGGTQKKEGGDKAVHVEGYQRDGDNVTTHSRSKPHYTDHDVSVSGYERDGHHVSGYKRYPQKSTETKRNESEIKEVTYILNGYFLEKGAKVENLGNRLNIEFNLDNYEKDGEVEDNYPLDELNINKMVDPTDPKTVELIKFFKGDYTKTPKDLPPLIVDGESMDILDGNHRAFVYHTLYFDFAPVQFMKKKEDAKDVYSLTIKQNLIMPMTPVASSYVRGVGISDTKLIVQFHKSSGSPGSGSTYAYEFGDPEKAESEYRDMLGATSKGGFVWDRLRGDTIGPAWGTGNPTPGGTTASLVPYEKMGRTPVGLEGGYKEYQAKAEELRDWKMTEPLPSGEVLGKKRAYYPEQVGLERFKPTEFYTDKYQKGYPPNVKAQMKPGTMGEAEITLGKKGKKGGEGSVGRPTKGKPFFQYQKDIMKDISQMLPDAYKIYEEAHKVKTNEANYLGFNINEDYGIVYGIPMVPKEVPEEFNQSDLEYWFRNPTQAVKLLGGSRSKYYQQLEPVETIRYNRYTPKYDGEDAENWYAIVNGFSHTNAFRYLVNGRVQVEYQCPDFIKQQVGKEVPLGIYHNKEDPNSVDLPDWQVVGSYKVLGYDEGEDVARLRVNKKRVEEFFKEYEETDWVTPIFKEGKVPDISTAYPATVKYNSDLKKFIQTNFELHSVSIVEKGNCSTPFCTGELVKLNGALKKCISDKIPELSKRLKQQGTTLSMDEIIDMATEQCDLLKKEEKKD